METHTKGPWRVNERLLAIVSDEPCTDILGAENVEHYGGYLIAESIAPINLSIIAAAPELYDALRELLTDMVIAQGNMRKAAKRDPAWEGCAEIIQPRVDAARAAIAKAEGK